MKSFRMVRGVLVVSLVCLAGTVRADLVPNGGFDTATMVDGWTNPTYNGAPWSPDDSLGSATSGCVTMTNPTWISSPTVTCLIDGGHYEVSFYAKLLSLNGATNPLDTVMIAASTTDVYEVQLTDQWVKHSYEFTASSAVATSGFGISFLDSATYWTGGPANTGAPATFGIDNVSLTAVPEPSALVLAATVLFGLLAYAWRKRK